MGLRVVLAGVMIRSRVDQCLWVGIWSKKYLIVRVSPRLLTWILKSPVMMNSWGVVAAWEWNDENWLRKVKKGWEYGDGGVVDNCWTLWVKRWEILELWMNIRMKSNDEQQSSEWKVLLLTKEVPPARMGLDGLPVWEREQRKESNREVWRQLAREVLWSYESSFQ